ncbi:glycosyltransferase family 4 protein [Phreatobacter aquaticus]|uniref:Glycosyltransferase family 4 protein n=1 Tax=Phreatobacter aquaticus TaxID=2570229 RepID=A0A4D7QSG0_9HYPH|nr:glycosyltransferase family 4 protein [Phreatobacter aquaticus]QCK88174.1 glycosyltransferase family 4 protein [Phreatobacter aquaticus]
MGRIVFTGIASRSIANWVPALHELRSRGHDVRSLLFPHIPDPDSQHLTDLGFEELGTFPIAEHLSRLPPQEATALAMSALALVRKSRPDVLLLTTCHAGPELVLAGVLATEPGRPVVIGCQHGFVQNWDVYWAQFPFDRFLVFGQRFQQVAPPHLASRISVGGLPKLDCIKPMPRDDFERDQRPMLFAAQMIPSDRLKSLLISLPLLTGRPVHIRPHPEHRTAFAGLPEDLRVVDCEEAIESQMDRYSLLLTTGSTTVLEAMAAGMPVVVLPEQRGEHYADAGIVASSMTGSDILVLARAQQTRDGRVRREQFLATATGSAVAGRTEIAAEAIEAPMRSA